MLMPNQPELPASVHTRGNRFRYQIDFSSTSAGDLLDDEPTRFRMGRPPRDPRLRRAIAAAAKSWVCGQLH